VCSAIGDEPGLDAVNIYIRRLSKQPGIPAGHVPTLRGLAHIIRAP
jgi:hypothetical protein